MNNDKLQNNVSEVVLKIAQVADKKIEIDIFKCKKINLECKINKCKINLEKEYEYKYYKNYEKFVSGANYRFLYNFFHWFKGDIEKNGINFIIEIERYKTSHQKVLQRLSKPSLRQVYKYLTRVDIDTYSISSVHEELRKKYAASLKIFGKRLFDPFQRRSGEVCIQIDISKYYKQLSIFAIKTKILNTTLAQLLFFKFYYENITREIEKDILAFNCIVSSNKQKKRIQTNNNNNNSNNISSIDICGLIKVEFGNFSPFS
jgi:hypothetical protein